MTLAKRIRDCRYAKGWGPDELAQRADISRTALYQIECGKTESPRAGTIRRIARALEVPVESLMGVGTPLAEAAPPSLPRDVFQVSEADGGAMAANPFTARAAGPAREAEILRKLRE